MTADLVRVLERASSFKLDPNTRVDLIRDSTDTWHARNGWGDEFKCFTALVGDSMTRRTVRAITLPSLTLCTECFAPGAIDVKDADYAQGTALMLVLALDQHRRLRSEVAGKLAGGVPLHLASSLDQTAEWLQAGADQASRKDGADLHVETLELVHADAAKSFPVAKAAAATFRARADLERMLPSTRRRRGKPSLDLTGHPLTLFVFAGTRRDQRLSLTPAQRAVVLSHRVLETPRRVVVMASGVAAAELSRAKQSDTIVLERNLSLVELDTALALWDGESADGVYSDLGAAVAAAQNL